MNIFSVLSPYRLLIEISLVLLVGGAVGAAWVVHNHKEQKIGEKIILAQDDTQVNKQKKLDNDKIIQAETLHAKEVEEIKNAYLTPIPGPVRVYVPTPTTPSVRETGVHDSPNTPAPVVQDNCRLHPDRAAAYELLLKRADGLSADVRELNKEIH